MALTKAQLRDRFVDALMMSGASVSYIGAASIHPYELIANIESVSTGLLVYIWNITHGGKNRAANEFRIQITGVDSVEVRPGYKTILLGYFEPNNTFAGWDATKHLGDVAASPSLQIVDDHLNASNLTGISLYQKSNEIVVAFAPGFASEYVLNLEVLHDSITAIDQQAVESVVSANAGHPIPEPPASSEARKRQIHSFAKLHRAADFRKRVLSAYENSCAFCGVQLQLVEAAHLIPVSYPGSTDATSNGLCLCASHHKAFDQGTLAIDTEYRVLVSHKRLNRIEALNLHARKNEFIAGLRTQAIIPADTVLRPTVQNIETALIARDTKFEDLTLVAKLQS